ncbi:hypothetical protein LMG30113_07577 [Burkholderia paludis]|nr:hypothetical protein LMG30113_07577 [Burkholderia paludis]
MRIMIASVKPRSSMTNATMMYITPSRLWSTVVSHSVHSHFHRPVIVSAASTASTTRPMRTPADMMMGS